MTSKQKKKRNKKYHGEDAAVKKPQVTKISVPKRNKFQKIYHGNKDRLKGHLQRIAVVFVILLVFYLLNRLISLIF